MVWKFEKEQKVFEVKGVKCGGQLGEYPTVLIGSIFYEGHKIVEDPKKGFFDRLKAEALIKKLEELMDKTGNPSMLDVVALNAEAMEKYLDFITGITKFPLLIDLAQPIERIKTLKFVAEVGIQDAIIYNSIDENWRKEELETIKQSKVRSAIILILGSTKVLPKDRLSLLEKLIKVAEEASIKNLFVDVGVLDVPSIGLAAETIYNVKKNYGLPVGCGPCNATTTWKKGKKQFGKLYSLCEVAVNVLVQCVGANFILYGPIEDSEKVFTACAMVDALIGYDAKFSGIKPKIPHPLNKIF